jgi:hypothetical protein
MQKSMQPPCQLDNTPAGSQLMCGALQGDNCGHNVTAQSDKVCHVTQEVCQLRMRSHFVSAVI